MIGLGLLGLLVLALTVFTLLPRWKRHRVRVTGVARARSEMARHDWHSFPPLTPVGGASAPRNAPPTGPQQPGDSPEGGDVEGDTPPTAASAPSAGSVVRCRRTLMFGDLGPNISVGPRSAA